MTKLSLDPAHRGVGVQMATHVLNLEFQLLLRTLGSTLWSLLAVFRDRLMSFRTLKARCSRKCAVPLVSAVSALEPASIQTPTVDVCAQGEYSVATYSTRVRKVLRDAYQGQLASIEGAHGQSILEGRGLSFAGGRGRSEASSERTDGRQTSTVSQTLREVQS